MGGQPEAFQLCMYRLCLVPALGHCYPDHQQCPGTCHCSCRVGGEAHRSRSSAGPHRNAVGQAPYIQGPGVPGDGIHTRCARLACPPPPRGAGLMTFTSHLLAQLLDLFAAGLLLISFAMLSERRTQRLVTLFAWQGAVLFASTLLVAHSAALREVYYSAALTLILKVIVLPSILPSLIRRPCADWDTA